MRRLITSAVALALGGCTTLGGGLGQRSDLEALKALGEHISTCERKYQGGLGLGAGFTFSIDCKPQPAGQGSPDPASADASFSR